VRELEADVREQQRAQSRDVAGLESGSDLTEIEYFLTYWSTADQKSGRDQKYRERPKRHLSGLMFSWDEILLEVGPRLLPEGPASEIEAALKELVRNGIADQDDFPADYGKAGTYGPLDVSVREVTFHLKALGAIETSSRRHPIADTESYWSLTDFGESHLVALKAPKRSVVPPKKTAAKKTAAKKTAAKRTTAKKVPAKKTTAKKVPAKKTAAR
jgi:hypothetical protein